jgi:hypothetical protein
LGSVLQVFFNLQCLPQQCDDAVQDVVERLVEDTKAALDPDVLPAIDTQGSAWQSALWSRYGGYGVTYVLLVLLYGV